MKAIKDLFRFILIVLIVSVFACSKERSDVRYDAEREAVIISSFLDSLHAQGYVVDTTMNGIYYVILKEGEGENAMPGDSIGLSYVGFFPESGLVFDASDFWYENGLWKYRYYSTNLIPGFEDAIGLLNKGSEGLFLIPSNLAYGSQGTESIPPFSALAFHIALQEIYIE